MNKKLWQLLQLMYEYFYVSPKYDGHCSPSSPPIFYIYGQPKLLASVSCKITLLYVQCVELTWSWLQDNVIILKYIKLNITLLEGECVSHTKHRSTYQSWRNPALPVCVMTMTTFIPPQNVIMLLRRWNNQADS